MQLMLAFVASGIALLGGKAMASPHHFERWQRGVVTEVSSDKRKFSIKDPQTREQLEFVWDEHARIWRGQSDAAAGKSIAAGSIKTGESVRVMSRRAAGQRIAKRIIILTEQ